MNRWRSRRRIGAAVVAVVLITLFLFRAQVVGFTLARVANAFGYAVSYASVNDANGRLVIDHLAVASNAGEPVLTADLVAVSYDLRHVFGSAHPFGVTGIEIDRPALTYIKHRDGTSNITIPAATGTPKPSGPLQIPQLTFALRNGSIGIRDDTRIFAHSRRIAVQGLNVDARLDPAAISKIALGLTLQDADGTFPISGAGTLDAKRGLELSRISSRKIGLSALVDYALNSAALHIAGGEIDDIDARIYGLRDRAGTMDRHIGVTANLDHFQPYLGGIAKPLRDGRGALRIYDRGLAITKVDGSIAGIPVRIAGGIYDLTNPTLRLGIAGNGDLSKLLTLSDAAKKLPVSGPIAFQLFVEGNATQPLTLVGFTSPHLSYGKFPFENASGAIALHGQEAAILRTSVGYDGATAGVRGALDLGKHTTVDLLAHASVPAQRFPYAVDVLGAMPVLLTAAVSGTDANLRTSGFLSGTTATTQLAGTFSVDGTGVGNVGPITIDGPGKRTLYARVALDRPHGGGAAFVSFANFRIATGGAEPRLPGLTLANVPPIRGTLEGDVAAAFADRNVLGGGNLHAFGVRALGYPVDDLTAHAGVLASLAHPTDARVNADVRYRGALAPLAAAAGGRFAATGSVDIPVHVAANGTGAVLAQIDDARFANASVAGIALRSLAGTVGIRGRTIDVYALQAGVDAGNVVARGSFGNGGTLAVSTSGVDLAKLRSAGLPVRAGSISAIASIGGTVTAPHADGGIAASDVALSSPQTAGLTVNASTGLSYANGTLGLSDAILAAGPAIASLDGDVAGLRGDPKKATVDLHASVRQADIATLAGIVRARQLSPEGSLDADVRILGIASAPGVSGSVAIPEGSINGLRYRDARVALRGNAADVHAENGTVTVGTSVIGFGADIAQGRQAVTLHAPNVDLADFNDYFDPGDLLGGKGSIEISADNAPDRLATSGRVRLADTRVNAFVSGVRRPIGRRPVARFTRAQKSATNRGACSKTAT